MTKFYKSLAKKWLKYKSPAKGLGLLTNSTAGTLQENFVMQSVSSSGLFTNHQYASELLSQAGGWCSPSTILVRALSTAPHVPPKHKRLLHPQHHKVSSWTKNQNSSIQHTLERCWDVQTTHVSSRLGICILQASRTNSDIPQESQSTSSLPLHFISKEWTTFGHPTFGAETPTCRKQRKEQELGRMLRVSQVRHGQTQRKELSRNWGIRMLKTRSMAFNTVGLPGRFCEFCSWRCGGATLRVPQNQVTHVFHNSAQVLSYQK